MPPERPRYPKSVAVKNFTNMGNDSRNSRQTPAVNIANELRGERDHQKPLTIEISMTICDL